MPSGATPMVQSIVTRSMPAGMRRVFSELGAPLDTLDVRFVNGQFYSRLRPLIAPDRAVTRLPPMFLLKAVSRLHPEFRRRDRTAGEVMITEPWTQVVHDWHHGMKSGIEAANFALQSVDLAELDDDEVVAHVDRCVEHCTAEWERHFWLHGYDMGPIGRYLFEAREWGIDPPRLLSLLEGASPSTSAPSAQLAQIRNLVDATGATPRSLDELRALSTEIDRRVGDFLERRGTVLFSRYDVDGVTLGERPDLVLVSIMNAEVHDTTEVVAARIAQARADVPAEHREWFDELLRQARAAMDLRDDNGPTTAEWPLGLLRLALLELGRRMVACGRIDDPTLALELGPDEVGTALGGTPNLSSLRDRAATRQAMKRLVAPATLGAPEPAAPSDVLPANLARLAGMVQIVVREMGMDGDSRRDGLSGVGIGDATVTARARVAASPEEAFDVLEPGDILVVAGTTPAYNLVVSIAGGIVTADGGPMSHAAVIARELGIPAVVGARAAITDIPDGAMVVLDAAAGTVTVVADR
jgi:pyruvate,water dikinase